MRQLFTVRSFRSIVLVVSSLVLVACGDNGSSRPDAPPAVNPDGAIDGPVDAMPDAPPIPDGIAEARAAADGTGLTLAINNVTVTYLKPQIGSATNDPAGFTIQASQMGPALFVSVDPATLTPPAAVGDVVSFTITTMRTVGMQRRAQAITTYTRTSQGANVGALSQNVSNATDLVSAIDSYDSELVTVTGTFFENFANSGQSFQRSGLTTAGITGDVNLQLRAPAALVDALDMTIGCQITATNIPVGRFNAQAQLGVFSASDFVMSGCAAPVVTAVSALSSTSVRVTFSRNILPASVVADGSQFTFDNGVTATAAVVTGRTVTVTTSAQAVGTTYGVTVANTVTDLQASGIGTPNTGSFPGFVTPAVVRINEINANVGPASGCDLIELRVVTGGSMAGFKIQERIGGAGELNFTFPNLVVQTNDFVVIHLNSGSVTCNPNAATSETTTITDQPAATFAGNFDTAFDFWNADTGLTNTDNVFTLRDANDAIIDALFASDDPAGTAAGPTESAAALVGAANQWDPALATYLDDVFNMNAVQDLNGTGTATTGTSIQRLDNTDDNNVADWTTGPGAASTFGALNPGQTAF